MLDADIEALDGQIQQFRTQLRDRDIRSVEVIADQVMHPWRLPGTLHTDLCLGILRANIELMEKSKQWLIQGLFEGADIPKPWPDTPAVTFAEHSVAPRAVNHSTAKGKAEGDKLSDVLPRFLHLMTTGEGWRGQTLAQNQTTYRLFLECCGDHPVSHYQRKDFAKFYDLLRDLPALYSKKREWAGCSLAEIVERTKSADHPRLAMKTIKRHFSALGRLFTYLKRRGEYAGENPAHGFEFPSKGRARDRRKMWEGEALKKLFASPVWTGCLAEGRRSVTGSQIIKDEKYWLPILGLFHGNRLEEFAQLRRSDVRCERDIWFLDINAEDTKQIKNEQSKRRVPIHPRVRELVSSTMYGQ